MTELLDKAVAHIRTLPPGKQDAFALVLMHLAEDEKDVYQLTPEEEADLAEADAEVERGEFATDAEVEAVFSKHRR